jgi:hypothetical protein
VRNGLGRIEDECLTAVAAGNTGLAEVFNAVSDMTGQNSTVWIDGLAASTCAAMSPPGDGTKTGAVW